MIKYYIVFIRYMIDFMRLGYSLWRTKTKFNVKESKEVVFLHFNPEMIAKPDNVIIQIKKEFCDAYKKLRGIDPIVIALPLGYSMSFLDMKEFVSILPTDARNSLQTALYSHRKIEVVSNSEDINKIIIGTKK